MSFLGELCEFIRLRKKHYLLPILIPIVVIRALLVLPKASIGIFRDIESRCEAALWEWLGKLVATWKSHSYPGHSRRA